MKVYQNGIYLGNNFRLTYQPSEEKYIVMLADSLGQTLETADDYKTAYVNQNLELHNYEGEAIVGSFIADRYYINGKKYSKGGWFEKLSNQQKIKAAWIL